MSKRVDMVEARFEYGVDIVEARLEYVFGIFRESDVGIK